MDIHDISPSGTAPSSWAWILLSVAFIVTLSGCNNGSRESRDDRFSMSSLSAYNFSTEGIQEYYVDGAWGSGVGIGSGGGSVCCVQIPSKWYEGLQVNLEWRRSDCGKGVDENGRSYCRNEPGNPTVNLKRTIPVEPYSETGTIQIMFLPNDEIRIYVSEDAPWGPDHPSHLGSPRPLTPDEAQGLLAK